MTTPGVIGGIIKPYDAYLLLVVGLIKIADGSRSFRLKRLLARAVATAAFRLSPRRRRIREEALSQILPHAKWEIRQLVKHSFFEFWYDIFSLTPSRAERNAARFEARGLKHLQKALDRGKGVILWESHFFGRRELAKRILHEHSYSVSPVHADYHLGGFRNTGTWVSKHLIRHFLDKRERAFVKEVITLSRSESLTFARVLLDRLKKNEIICVSADGRVGYKFVSVEFLGRGETFSTGMVSLARLTGASILPLFCIPGDGDKTLLIIEPPIATESSSNREESLETSVRHYASLFESYIRSYPGSYRDWRLSDTPAQKPLLSVPQRVSGHEEPCIASRRDRLRQSD
jgi:KDO2-lipid IV(A) lauroyltransferase